MKTILAAAFVLTLAAPAMAQPYQAYQVQNGVMINRPGDGQTGGYGQRTDPGNSFYVPNAQLQQQSQQSNPSQQNWRQFMPAQNYNR